MSTFASTLRFDNELGRRHATFTVSVNGAEGAFATGRVRPGHFADMDLSQVPGITQGAVVAPSATLDDGSEVVQANLPVAYNPGASSVTYILSGAGTEISLTQESQQ